jgi:hypothetical protein
MILCSTCNVKAAKKDTENCSKCGKTQCLKHIYYYVDPNNERITKNTKGYCLECYYSIHDK